MPYSEAANAALAPSEPFYLADTGTNEDSNSVKLKDGMYATLKVGGAPIRVVFKGVLGLSSQVATTDMLLPAGDRFDWVVRQDTCVVYVEAGDGIAAYEAWVWNSSTKV